MSLLEVSGLSKTYTTRFGGAKVEALKSVTFSVESGEYVAVMGESGSGKTTLLNLLAALDRPTGGTVLLGGQNLAEIPEERAAAFRRDHLGFVFQDFSLLDTFSLEDNILLPLVLQGKSRGEMKSRLVPLADRLGISDLLKKYPYEVSGGQKQRAAVARALITRPQVLFADEPTGALDSGSTEELLRLFGTVNGAGQTIVMVTHSVRAASCAGRVLFLRDGAVAQELTRGTDTETAFYRRIADALTASQTGGRRGMNAFFYPRLALSGMRRDRRIYAPYLAACVFMTAVVYDLAFLADSPALYAVGSGVNGMGTSAIRLVMTLGKWVMAVFALLFFFYTNAFLIRRRKKELGLMSVLGMDRGALTSLLFWETAFSALVSLTAGLALGVLLTQLSARVLSHFARTELSALPLLDLGVVRFCVLTDAFIFFLLLLNAWRQVRRASAVSLLRSDSLGERPPRSQWLLVLPGLGLLGGAYYLAVTITEPITAMLVFFVAVVMVILATFLLFIAGSVTLCRTLQGNDRFYYQKKNFVALSSLVYRMKRSGAGLAVICILSTMILVMLGSTAGLYFGAEDVVRTLSAEMSREIVAEARAEFYATYGSLFFLALVLSTVFLLASVLMLYYKQLSEGYEDAARFAVMQRVGMTKRDIRTSVNAQLRMVFLLPLLAAFVHLAFAQPMIWRILRLFGLQNLPLVLGVTACACAVFTVLYCAACHLTSNAYCRIVGEGV